MRIAACIPCYNREFWILPYLEQLKNRNIDCVVSLSEIPWDDNDEDSLTKDKTEERCVKYFPEVRIVKGEFNTVASSFNAGMELLKEYDMVIVTDCDVFWTEEEHNRLLEHFKGYQDIYSLHYKKSFVEYVYDWQYGQPVDVEYSPQIFALKPSIKIINHASVEGNYPLKVIEDVKMHHFRYTKENGTGKKFYKIPDNPKLYKPAPKEIINLLNKWKTILE